MQRRVGAIVFYPRDYARLSWFDPDDYSRWMGTADSPLVFAALLCVAGGLSLSLRRSVVRVPLLALFLVGTLIAQARAGTAVLCLILVYAVLRPTMALWARALTAVLFGAAAYLVLTFGLATGLADRIANDSGSGAARLRALRFISDTAGSYVGTGRGLTASYDVARNAGLRTSLESSFLMYVVDVGLILATLYFGLQVVLVVRYGRHGYLPGATVAALGGDRPAAHLQRRGRGQPDGNADLGGAGHRGGRVVRPGAADRPAQLVSGRRPSSRPRPRCPPRPTPGPAPRTSATS